MKRALLLRVRVRTVALWDMRRKPWRLLYELRRDTALRARDVSDCWTVADARDAQLVLVFRFAGWKCKPCWVLGMRMPGTLPQ